MLGESNVNQDEVYENLKASRFKQQKLPAWRPVPTITSTTITFFTFGIVFIIIGIIVLVYSAKIVEIKTRYDSECIAIGEDCKVTIKVNKKMDEPVMMYYQLKNFYQNHRRYVKSKSDDQLNGKYQTLSQIKNTDSCDPVETNEEMDKLMNPWLGELSQINELPIPKLVDVKLDKSVPFSLDMFKTELNAIAPYAQVDSHRIWLSNLIDIAGGIQKTILIILTLLILTTAFTVIYTTRSGLLVQSGTLNLLQMMGAKDFTIAFNVAFHAFWKSFLGGIIGFLFSLPVVLIVITLVESQNDSLFTFGALNKMQWICVCTLPFIVGALAFITALLTAFKKLRAF